MPRRRQSGRRQNLDQDDRCASVPEEQSILNLSQARGIMETGESYEVIINKLPKKAN